MEWMSGYVMIDDARANVVNASFQSSYGLDLHDIVVLAAGQVELRVLRAMDVVNGTAECITWVAGGEVPQKLSEFWKKTVGTQIITQVDMLPVVLLWWECSRELAERSAIYYIDKEPARCTFTKGLWVCGLPTSSASCGRRLALDCPPQVSGLAETNIARVRTSARAALGRGAKLRRAAELELALKGERGRELSEVPLAGPIVRTLGTKFYKERRGRGQLRHLRTLADRLGWTPEATGFHTSNGSIRWEDASYYVVLAKAMLRALSAKKDHPSRSSQCGGWRVMDPGSRQRDLPPISSSIVLLFQRKEAETTPRSEVIPERVQVYGLLPSHCGGTSGGEDL
eukprot:2059604-Amphidinium_carterae.2